MQGFVEAFDELDQFGATVIGMSVDSWAANNAFAESLGSKFPILGDFPRYDTLKTYDTYNAETFTSRRITYVIDGEGVIRDVIDEPRDMEAHAKRSLEAVRTLAGQSSAGD